MTTDNTVPLSDEEVAHRKEVATEMLASWRAERPVSSHASDVKDASVLRYEDELRYLATIDQLTKQLAEAEQRLRDNVGPRSLERIADLERQLADQKERRFPIVRGGSVPWPVAELAYIEYAKRYGRGQSLERLAERGGFGAEELDLFLPDWRERVLRIADLERQLAERDQQLAESHGRADKLAKALGIYGNHDQTVYCPAAFNPHNDCACGFTLTLLLAERTKG